MSDLYEHNPNDHEDPVAGPTWTITLIGIVLLVVSVLGVTALFHDVINNEWETKVVSLPVHDLQVLETEQAARLEGPVRLERRIADEDSLVIPLDEAMRLVAEKGFEAK